MAGFEVITYGRFWVTAKGKERLGFLAKNGMSYSGMEYLPDEISLDKREPTSRT
jgi:hypothetical protein